MLSQQKILFLFVIVSILSTEFQSGDAARDFQFELLQYLKSNITNFSPSLRPILNPKQKLNVSLVTMLGQIVSVDSSKQSIGVSVVVYAHWFEERLTWEPEKFGNVTVLDWDMGQTWYPLLFVYNGMGDNMLLSPQCPSYITSVSPSKSLMSVAWVKELEFTCRFDMSRFPFDRHVCDMELYASDQGRALDSISLKKGHPLLPPTMEYNEVAGYGENNEWNLLNISTFASYRLYEVFKGQPKIPLSTYVMRVEIERVSTYYMLNVVTPLLLLTLLQVLVFFVPVESGEKMSFGISIMLSYTVFLLLLDGLLPKSQSMPAVASFITAAMVLSTVSLLLTSVVIRFHFAPESQPMPSCLHFVFVKIFGRLLLCSRRSDGRTEPQQEETQSCDTEVRKFDANEVPAAASGERRSDWQIAAVALERLMAIIGCLITVAIFCVFLLRPLVP